MKYKSRITIKKIILWVVVLTIALGWKYPLLGYSVPLVMFMGMLGGFLAGRYVCGNLCPRGAFIDLVLSKISSNRKIPKIIRGFKLRWLLFAFMMSFMVMRASANITSFDHWGHVFWQMCLVTTIIAVILAIIYSPRAWCAFCPMGTLQAVFGGDRAKVKFISSCVSCSLCAKLCPMDINILDFKDNGQIDHPDCIKCRECVHSCKLNALS